MQRPANGEKLRDRLPEKVIRDPAACLVAVGVHLGAGGGGGGGAACRVGQLSVEPAVFPHLLQVTVEAVGREVADGGGRRDGTRLRERVAPGAGEEVTLFSWCAKLAS